MGRSAGIDWASERHAICVLENDGRVVEQSVSEHDANGLSALCARLIELGVERVALERPDGVLVEQLLAAELVVFAIHPNQVKAARPRFSVAGGKSDGFDAYLLAELARTDAHRFRPLQPDHDATKALRALTRAREDLVATRVGLANQLRAELERFWPGASRVFAEIDSPIALAFLERYPSPSDARSLGSKRMASFLARHNYSGRRTPDELVKRVRDAAKGNAGELELEARRGVVLALVAALKPRVNEIKRLSSEIAAAVRAHPDGPILLSLFHDPKSTVTAARIVAELGDNRARYPNNAALAADAGMSPVALESGKHKHACFRRACDHRLRDAISTLANASRHHNPWATDIYQRARARGCDHPHAIRILGRAWLRIIWRIWQNHETYNPTKHGRLQHLIATQG